MGGHADRGRKAPHGAAAPEVRGRGGSLSPTPPLRQLLAGAIDYAGLFPPAGLPIEAAASEYARYRTGTDSWALGRFVAPWRSLDGLADIASTHGASPAAPWPVSAVADAVVSVDAVERERDRLRYRLAIEALELKWSADVRAVAGATVASGFEIFVEVTPGDDLDAIMALLAASGAAAKIRTGGVTPDAFPSSEAVLRVLRAAHRHAVRFKATAGLHHPLRGEYPLTYEAGGPTATMFGYLNIMLASALIIDGHGDDVVRDALDERSADALATSGDMLLWRDIALGAGALTRLRLSFMAGFGSCSFREPLDEVPRPLVAGSAA